MYQSSSEFARFFMATIQIDFSVAGPLVGYKNGNKIFLTRNNWDFPPLYILVFLPGIRTDNVITTQEAVTATSLASIWEL